MPVVASPSRIFRSLFALERALLDGDIPAGDGPVEAVLGEDGSVRVGKKGRGEKVRVGCWAQLLPVVRGASFPPTLLDIPEGDLGKVLVEIERGGKKPSSVRGGEPGRLLVGADGFPAFTALRPDVTAFYRAAPGVWVESNHVHPLASRLKARAKHSLFLRAGRDWRYVPDSDPTELGERPTIEMPPWRAVAAGPLPPRMSLGVRLTRLTGDQSAEMWVVAVPQLSEFARTADARLVARLEVCLAGDRILLRLKKSSQPPPVLPFPNEGGYAAYGKMNLYVPAGRKLVPSPRRDVLRNLLCPNPGRVVWLEAGPAGAFTPQSAPDEFVSLVDWVGYEVPPASPRTAWVGANRFVLDAFACTEGEPKVPPPPKEKKPKNKGGKKEMPVPVAPVKRPPAPAPKEEPAWVLPPSAPPNELLTRRAELEDRFRSLTGPPDQPERVALWGPLAGLNTALADDWEADLCRANALWFDTPAEWGKDVGEKAVRGTLEAATPTVPEIRRAVTGAIKAAAGGEAWLGPLLPPLSSFLERHEQSLGIRQVWLAWWHTARTDPLALARARDRLLERLLNGGLSPERDLPAFLRGDGAGGQRARLVRARLGRVRALAEKWQTEDVLKVNRPYSDLLFAYGHAKLGEETPAGELMGQARKVIAQTEDPVHAFLGDAFAFRVTEALGGRGAGLYPPSSPSDWRPWTPTAGPGPAGGTSSTASASAPACWSPATGPTPTPPGSGTAAPSRKAWPTWRPGPAGSWKGR
jgi:hypothetical protein